MGRAGSKRQKQGEQEEQTGQQEEGDDREVDDEGIDAEGGEGEEKQQKVTKKDTAAAANAGMSVKDRAIVFEVPQPQNLVLRF